MCATFKIVSNNYSILHLRLGDEHLVKHVVNIQKYNEMLPIIDAHITPNDNMLIIADSFAFKQYLSHVRPHLTNRIIPTMPVHLSHSTDKDAHMIKETLFDLFLLTKSKCIKTYTIYTWVSGFVKWVSCAFNIPLISINHSNTIFKTPNIKQQMNTMVRTPNIKQHTNINVNFKHSFPPSKTHPKLKLRNLNMQFNKLY
jgi:hypothetical protein